MWIPFITSNYSISFFCMQNNLSTDDVLHVAHAILLYCKYGSISVYKENAEYQAVMKIICRWHQESYLFY